MSFAFDLQDQREKLSQSGKYGEQKEQLNVQTRMLRIQSHEDPDPPVSPVFTQTQQYPRLLFLAHALEVLLATCPTLSVQNYRNN